jgi:hypothetical protein
LYPRMPVLSVASIAFVFLEARKGEEQESASRPTPARMVGTSEDYIS